jgi:hypothetical protein
MGYLASMRIWRGNSEAGQLEEHKVEVGEGEVVLDVIHRLQATEAPDLAVRWNCKAGKFARSQLSRIWLQTFRLTTRKLAKFQHSRDLTT